MWGQMGVEGYKFINIHLTNRAIARLRLNNQRPWYVGLFALLFKTDKLHDKLSVPIAFSDVEKIKNKFG